MNFFPATASIDHFTFHLNSGSHPNYRLSLYAKHYKKLFILYQKLANNQIYRHVCIITVFLIYRIILT